MRPQRLSRVATSQPFRSSFIRTAAGVFDDEIHSARAQACGIANAMPNTSQIVDHVREDLHEVINIAAKLLAAMACGVDQVVERRRQVPQRLTCGRCNQTIVR